MKVQKVCIYQHLNDNYPSVFRLGVIFSLMLLFLCSFYILTLKKKSFQNEEKTKFLFLKETTKKEGEHLPQGGSWEPSDSSLTSSVFPVQWCQQSPRCIVVNLELTRLWKWQWMDSPVRPRRLGSELGAPSFSGTRSSFCKRKPLLSECGPPGEQRKGLWEIQVSCSSLQAFRLWYLRHLLFRCFYIIELTECSLLARWLQGQLSGGKGICECLPLWGSPHLQDVSRVVSLFSSKLQE